MFSDEKNDTQRTTMKKVDLPIWSVQDCRRKVDIFKSNGFNFPEGTMCAGGEEDKDTCEVQSFPELFVNLKSRI